MRGSFFKQCREFRNIYVIFGQPSATGTNVIGLEHCHGEVQCCTDAFVKSSAGAQGIAGLLLKQLR